MVLLSKKKALNMPRKTKFVGKTDIEIVKVVDKNVELNNKQKRLLKNGKLILGDGNYYTLKLPNGEFVKNQESKIVKFNEPIIFVKDNIFCSLYKVVSVQSDGKAYIDYPNCSVLNYFVKHNELYYKTKNSLNVFHINETPVPPYKNYKALTDDDAKHFGLTKYVDKNGNGFYFCLYKRSCILVEDGNDNYCQYDQLAIDVLKEIEKNPQLLLTHSKKVIKCVFPEKGHVEEYCKRCLNIVENYISSQKDNVEKQKLIEKFALNMEGILGMNFRENHKKDLSKEILSNFDNQSQKSEDNNVFDTIFDEGTIWEDRQEYNI